MGRLDGKVALVTGGAGELGSATARLFVAEGARVALCDLGTAPDGTGRNPGAVRELAQSIPAPDHRLVARADDVTTDEGSRRAVAATVDAFGRLDVLVNAVGAVAHDPLLDMDEDRWDRIMAIHLRSAFLCTQHAARQMVEQGEGGRVVNLTSLAGLYGAGGRCNYAAAKAGIYGLTRAAAIDLEPRGITVNAIAPIAATRLTQTEPQLEGLWPLTADQVAPAVLFFACDLCEDRTGEVLGLGGNRAFRLKVVESRGAFKEGTEPWSAAEIAEHWDQLGRFK